MLTNKLITLPQRTKKPSNFSHPIAHSDLLTRIISHTDRPTLAILMRVSEKLYHLDLPHLYKKIELDHSSNCDPFIGADVRFKGKVSRSGPPALGLKCDLLQHILYLTVRTNWEDSSSMKIDGGANLTSLKVLAIVMNDDDGGLASHFSGQHTLLLDDIRASELVIQLQTQSLYQQTGFPNVRLSRHHRIRKVHLTMQAVIIGSLR